MDRRKRSTRRPKDDAQIKLDEDPAGIVATIHVLKRVKKRVVTLHDIDAEDV